MNNYDEYKKMESVVTEAWQFLADMMSDLPQFRKEMRKSEASAAVAAAMFVFINHIHDSLKEIISILVAKKIIDLEAELNGYTFNKPKSGRN